MSSIAFMAGVSPGTTALGAEPTRVADETILPAQNEEPPKYHIKFAVCGMSHDHIYGMIGAVQRGGGEMVAAWGAEPDKLAAFTKRFPNVKIVATQDEVLHDPAIQLVLSSQVASERAPLGVRAMRREKTFWPTNPASPRWNSSPTCAGPSPKPDASTGSCTANGSR